jgi:hypothetical protein
LNDALPELVKMLQKRHLSRCAIFVVVEFGLIGSRLRTWKGDESH